MRSMWHKAAFAALAIACNRVAPVEAPSDTTFNEEPGASLAGEEGDDPLAPVAGSAPVAGMAGAALLAEVDRELLRMKASTYAHRTRVEETAGTFEYDCSGFLVYALSRAVPDALAAVQTTTRRRPRSAELVAFLERIPAGKSEVRWQRVGRVQDLAPGDVVVWLKPADSRSTNTGHTMVVHGAPSADPEHPGAFVLPIADSTESPHGPGDARAVAHTTGLGRAEIVLVADASGAPVAYRWSRTMRSREKATTIILGRLR